MRNRGRSETRSWRPGSDHLSVSTHLLNPDTTSRYLAPVFGAAAQPSSSSFGFRSSRPGLELRIPDQPLSFPTPHSGPAAQLSNSGYRTSHSAIQIPDQPLSFPAPYSGPAAQLFSPGLRTSRSAIQLRNPDQPPRSPAPHFGPAAQLSNSAFRTSRSALQLRFLD